MIADAIRYFQMIQLSDNMNAHELTINKYIHDKFMDIRVIQ